MQALWGNHYSWWETHIHLGNEQQLLFDAQEDGIKGQLLGLLVKASQGGPGRSQQGVITAPFLLRQEKHKALC
jgi:hypothetical protein